MRQGHPRRRGRCQGRGTAPSSQEVGAAEPPELLPDVGAALSDVGAAVSLADGEPVAGDDPEAVPKSCTQNFVPSFADATPVPTVPRLQSLMVSACPVELIHPATTS